MKMYARPNYYYVDRKPRRLIRKKKKKKEKNERNERIYIINESFLDTVYRSTTIM